MDDHSTTIAKADDSINVKIGVLEHVASTIGIAKTNFSFTKAMVQLGKVTEQATATTAVKVNVGSSNTIQNKTLDEANCCLVPFVTKRTTLFIAEQVLQTST